MPEIEAQERLEEVLVAQVPWMTATGRRDVLRRWREQAGLAPGAGVPRVRAEDLAGFFRALGAARGR